MEFCTIFKLSNLGRVKILAEKSASLIVGRRKICCKPVTAKCSNHPEEFSTICKESTSPSQFHKYCITRETWAEWKDLSWKKRVTNSGKKKVGWPEGSYLHSVDGSEIFLTAWLRCDDKDNDWQSSTESYLIIIVITDGGGWCGKHVSAVMRIADDHKAGQLNENVMVIVLVVKHSQCLWWW